MEEFLKDSPSDMNPTGNSTTTGSTTSTPLNPTNARNDYSYKYNTYTSNGINDLNAFQGYGGQDSSNLPYQATNNNYINDPNALNTNALLNTGDGNSYHNDPFLDDLDNLNFPDATVSHTDPQLQFATSYEQQNIPHQFINPATTSNLDEIISPPTNTSIGNGNNSFLNPHCFSPPGHGSNFNSLNSIAEDDNLSSSFNNNTFSPSMSRHGSVSVPNNYTSSYNNVPDFQSGSYLSPQTNSQYVSPNYDSFDTLRSPSNSYLNSPPQYQGIPSHNISTSIPTTIKTEYSNSSLLSPPTTSSMSTSVPSGGNMRDAVPTKQLSKDEKLKRRREFHNAVERRRRDLIKERIKELGLIVPPSLLNPQLCAVQMLQRHSSLNSDEINNLISSIKVKETKPNKSTILNKSVDYINHLKYVLDQQDKTRDLLATKIEEIEQKLNNVSFSNRGNEPYEEPSQFSTSQFTPQEYASSNTSNNPMNESNFNPDDFFLDMIGNTNSEFAGVNNNYNSNASNDNGFL